MSIDRQNRDILAESLRQFLNGHDPAAACGPQTLAAAYQSLDPVVRYFYWALEELDYGERWYIHGLTKAEWDHHQRLILLLESDAQLLAKRQWRWSWTQLAAGFALVLVSIGLYLSNTWFVAAIVMLLGSAVVFQIADTQERDRFDNGLTPFDSFAHLRAVRTATPRFQKQRYLPRKMSVFGVLYSIHWAISAVLTLLFGAPFLLFFQVFPTQILNAHIVELENES